LLSPCCRILLRKLVHLAPDLGLPVDFRNKLCNLLPNRFVSVNTSYGRALQLVSYDNSLAHPIPPLRSDDDNRIMKRPRRSDFIPLRQNLNIKQPHCEFLLRLRNLPDISPMNHLFLLRWQRKGLVRWCEKSWA
jgi:Plant organelle RNA recognition domain